MVERNGRSALGTKRIPHLALSYFYLSERGGGFAAGPHPPPHRALPRMYEEDGEDVGEAPSEETLRERRARTVKNLSPEVREMFEAKKRELLERYPDFYTKPIQNGPVVSLSTKLDFAVVVFALLVLAAALYFQEGVNVLELAAGLVSGALDPGLPPRGAER